MAEVCAVEYRLAVIIIVIVTVGVLLPLMSLSLSVVMLAMCIVNMITSFSPYIQTRSNTLCWWNSFI